jgi:hypothetical protein
LHFISTVENVKTQTESMYSESAQFESQQCCHLSEKCNTDHLTFQPDNSTVSVKEVRAERLASQFAGRGLLVVFSREGGIQQQTDGVVAVNAVALFAVFMSTKG